MQLNLNRYLKTFTLLLLCISCTPSFLDAQTPQETQSPKKNTIYADANIGLTASVSANYEYQLLKFKSDRVRLFARMGVGYNSYVLYNDPKKYRAITGLTTLIGSHQHAFEISTGAFWGTTPITDLGYRYINNDGIILRAYVGFLLLGASVGYSW